MMVLMIIQQTSRQARRVVWWVLCSGLSWPGAILAAGPERVLSIHLCTDQLLLELADARQIAGLSPLATDPDLSARATQAGGFPAAQPHLEDIMARQPDLILANDFSDAKLLSRLRDVGYRVEIFESTTRLADIMEQIERLGVLLGQDARAHALQQQMQERLPRFNNQPDAHSPRALFLQPRFFSSGHGTLQDEALRLAGWRNLASDLGVTGYGPIDLERVVLAKPDLILTSAAAAPETRSLAQRMLDHPVLRRIHGDRPLLNIPYRYWICGGSMLLDAVSLLVKARQPLP